MSFKKLVKDQGLLGAILTEVSKASTIVLGNQGSAQDKALRWASTASQWIGAIAALPFAWPVSVTLAFTGTLSFLRKFRDFVDDGKMNDSAK